MSAPINPELLSFLTHWESSACLVPKEGDRDELVTRVALAVIGGEESTLNSQLDLIEHDQLADESLKGRVQKMREILSKAHSHTREELEAFLELTTWDGGGCTEEAKIKIIECFLTDAETLDLTGLRLTSLPLSLPGTISKLICSSNVLKTLFVISPTLTVLVCSDNQLQDLSLACPELRELDCGSNELATLSVTSPKLEVLHCDENQLQTLSVESPELKQLNCSANELTALSVTSPNLVTLYCMYNELTTLSVTSPVLETLDCSFNQLTTLSVTSPVLETLDCSFNQLRISPVSYEVPNYNDSNNLIEPSDEFLEISENFLKELPWCGLLINYISENHITEDFALIINGYKMWSDDVEEELIITIKPLEGEETLRFVFNADNKLDRIEGESLDELKDLKNPWNQILNRFADEVLALGGIVRDGYSISVHPMAFQKIPEKVLEKIPDLVNAAQSWLEGRIIVHYLRDNFTRVKAIDMGGPSREFVHDLLIALFHGKPPLIKVNEDKTPLMSGDESIPKHFGAFISLVITNPHSLIIGNYLSQKWYSLLKKAVSGASEEQLLIEFAMPDRSLGDVTIAEQLRERALFWYMGNAVYKHDAIKIFEQLSLEEASKDLEDENLRLLIKEWILDRYQDRALFLLKVQEGLTPIAKAKLLEIPEEQIAEKIRGAAVTIRNLLEFIDWGKFSLAGAEKKAWLLEKFAEKKDDLVWLSKFVSFVTGLPFLPPVVTDANKIKINFLPVSDFNAHTCFYMLNVPENVSDKDLFYAALELCISDPGRFTEV
jgi:hypothetical protein